MAEIIELIDPKVVEQGEWLIKTIRAVNEEYTKLSKVYDAISDKTRVQIKEEQELEKLNKLKLQTDAQVIKNEQLLAKELERKAAQQQKAAKAAEKENSAYEKLNTQYKNSVKIAKDLAAQYGVNSAKAKEAAREANKYGDALKKIDSAAAGQNFRKVGSYFTEGFKAILSAAGVIGGITMVFNGIKNIIQSSAAFEKALSSLSAITGATGKDLLFFKNAAIETSKKTLQSATDIVKAYEKVGSAAPELLKDKEALAAVTEQAIILSEASGGNLGLDGAITAVTASMNQFGLKGKDASKIINVLAAGSLAGSAEVANLSEAMKNVGTVASNSNMSLEQTVAALEVLGEKQLFGTEAGTKLRGVLLKLKDAGLGYASGTFKLSDAIKDANAKLASMGTELEKDAYKSKIFGAENITAGSIIIANADKYDELTKAVTGTTTALEQQKVQNDNLTGDLKRLSNSWDSFVLSVMNGANSIGKSIRGIVQGIQSIFDTMNDETILESYGLTKRLFQDSEKSAQGFIKLYRSLNSSTADMILKFKTIADFDAAIGAFTETREQYDSATKVGAAKQKLYSEAIDRLVAAKYNLITANNQVVNTEKTVAGLTEEQIKAAKKLADEQNKLGEAHLKDILDRGNYDKKQKETAIDLAEKSREEKLAIFIKEGEDFKANQDEITRINKENEDRRFDYNIKKAEEEAAKKKEIQKQYVDQSVSFVNSLFDLQQSRMDGELSALDAYYQTKIEAASNAGKNTEKLEAEYNNKRKKIEYDKAKSEQNQALFNVAIQTAQNVVKAYPNPYLIAGALAIGLAQAAIIKSEPLPAYAEGTDDAARTFLAGEAGVELMKLAGGGYELATKPKIYSGSKYEHAEIFPHDETQQILAANQMNGISMAGVELKLDSINKTVKESRAVVNIINKHDYRYTKRYERMGR